jgi:iron complex outermembrane receptor protein
MAGSAAGALLLSVPACAQGPAAKDYDISTQDLGSALSTLAHVSGLQLAANGDLIAGRKSAAVHGHFSAQEALDAALAGSGLTAMIAGDTIIIRGRAAVAASEAAAEGSAAQIVVTGSRIEKGAVASPIITLTQKEIRQSGQNDLGDVLRSLPQSFAGGQNPTVAPGADGIGNQDLTGGSAPNLRGLGADATLTLLNGHRLSYGSSFQGVDISSIPLSAVERVDIVTDGASAIYGSDAVGGVINVVLKPDYQGLTTSTRIGGATQGGDFEQQYNATGGMAWQSGGFIASYNYSDATEIKSQQRAFTANRPDGNTLQSAGRSHNGLISGHQALGPNLTFSIDATYNHRWSASTILTGAGVRYVNTPVDVSFSVAPALKLALGSAWSVSLLGVHGQDDTHYDQHSSSGSLSSVARGCYCNQIDNVELSAEGPVIHLPAGDARVALGGGYRHNSFASTSTTSTIVPDQAGSLRSYYGFGELFVPLVAPAQNVPLVRQLSLDAAIRYERYPGMAHVATPKLGLVYAPTSDMDLKFSWGQSFKAPTLLQTTQQTYAYLFDASLLAGGQFPAGAEALESFGGNRDLKPERATSWTTTLVLHPGAIPGLRLDMSYFHISYRDRIVQPFSSSGLFNALVDPVYQDFVVDNPSEAVQAALVNAARGVTNFSSGAYDPSSVVVMLNNLYFNAARQRIRGIDLGASYHAELGHAGALDLRANGTWLDSRQKITSTAPWQPLSGTIFNPPHYRGLVAATWSYGKASLTATVNYIGGLTDTDTAPHTRVGSQTTLDLVATLDTGKGRGLLGGVGLSLVMRNALDQRPPYAAPSGIAAYYVDYDSTNYSATGRFVGLTVIKSW